MKVAVHQGSVLSPFLFVIVMEALTVDVKEGLPFEILYADDFVLAAESMEQLRTKVLSWKACLEAKGLKMNVMKTKFMASGMDCGEVETSGKWSCVICRKGVGSNSVCCVNCGGWVHKRCSGVTGQLLTVAASYVCRVCEGRYRHAVNQQESIRVGDDEYIEAVSKFCYLGDMLNGGGVSVSASQAKIRCGWRKFRELRGLLTKRDVTLKLKGKIYAACVRSAMVYGSETWAMTNEEQLCLERTERRMLRWMCGLSLKDRVSSEEIRERMGVDSVLDVVRRGRLRWLGHVLRKDENDWVKKCIDMDVHGRRGRGRPKKTWRQVVEKDMRDAGMKTSDAVDRDRWRRLLWSANGQPLRKRGKRP